VTSSVESDDPIVRPKMLCDQIPCACAEAVGVAEQSKRTWPPPVQQIDPDPAVGKVESSPLPRHAHRAGFYKS
jgi:hypothetical protein